MSTRVEAPDLLTPAEVAKILRVDPKTVRIWADQGKLVSIRTPGNHRRFSRQQIDQMLDGIVRPGRR